MTTTMKALNAGLSMEGATMYLFWLSTVAMGAGMFYFWLQRKTVQCNTKQRSPCPALFAPSPLSTIGE